MFNLTGDVLIEDEFLRDGLQNESRLFSVGEKLRFISNLESCGVRRIQVGSFVHPKWVPQMASTDEVFAALQPSNGVVHTALVLNMAGLVRALAVRVRHLSISISASEAHSQKNTNKTVSEAQTHIKPVIERALAEGVIVRAGIQSALGCGFEGAVPEERILGIAKLYSEIGVQEINIADTAGLANPRQVHDLITAIQQAIRPEVKLSLHLHDTRGLGLANMMAGLLAGVRIFDAATGGLGGCPFILAASGNIATEDAVFALEEMGLRTGIDWHGLGVLTLELESLLERRLPGRMAHLTTNPEAANVKD
jgi:hydroxymethylglutaryl-CoA lyase